MSTAFSPRVSLDAGSDVARFEWASNEERAREGTAYRVVIRNTGTAALRLTSATTSFPLPIDSAARALRIAFCGAHSGSQHSRSDVRPVASGVESWWVGARRDTWGGVVLGALDFTQWVSAVHITADAIAIRHWLEQYELEPGAALKLPEIWLGSTMATSPLSEMEAYASLVGERHGFRWTKPPCGWGSWGEFSERIDEGLVRETLLAVAGSSHFGDVIDVIQIDDGWAQLLDNARVAATWQPNSRFAWGIAPLAAQLTGSDRRTGLWILPFTANEGAPVIEEHPEYLVQSETGGPLRIGGGSSYVFDPTHAGAAAELRRTFRRFGDWGVRYLKLDFLRALLAPDPIDGEDDVRSRRAYADKTSRATAYRRGLALVRESVGDETFVLGCSSPLGAGAGLLDAQRIGPDIEPLWEGRRSGIRDCARAVAANWFWQGRAWINDPDYLITGNSIHESRFWAAVVALSGGSSILSADLEEMEPWREELLAFVTPPIGRSARPLDLFASMGEPTVWSLPCAVADERWTVLGLFNWKASGADIHVRLADLDIDGPAHVWDPWRRTYTPAEGSFRVNVESHDARFVAVRAAEDRPCVVGTDIHFTQGERELTGIEWDGRALRLQPADTFRPGRLTIWSPPRLRPNTLDAEWRGTGWIVSVPWAPGRNTVTLSFVEAPADGILDAS